MNFNHEHAFVVCAYKESPHLEDCIVSLENQTRTSPIIVCTATPNDHIAQIADKHGVDLRVRDGAPNICDDWNFAISQSDSKFATIAHQDDIYEKEYVETVLELFSKANNPIIFFSDYSEIRNGGIVSDTPLLNIKRKMLKPLKDKSNWSSKKARRRALATGSSICCPSVTFNLEKIETPIFEKDFSCDLDWDAWERLSRSNGDFVYSPKRLMRHRIHEGSETTKLIEDNTRTKEDLQMLKRFWPSPIAHGINRIYSLAQKSN